MTNCKCGHSKQEHKMGVCMVDGCKCDGFNFYKPDTVTIWKDGKEYFFEWTKSQLCNKDKGCICLTETKKCGCVDDDGEEDGCQCCDETYDFKEVE